MDLKSQCCGAQKYLCHPASATAAKKRIKIEEKKVEVKVQKLIYKVFAGRKAQRFHRAEREGLMAPTCTDKGKCSVSVYTSSLKLLIYLSIQGLFST